MSEAPDPVCVCGDNLSTHFSEHVFVEAEHYFATNPTPAAPTCDEVCPCPIPGSTHPIALHADQGEVDRVTRLLMNEWERVEHPVTVSHVASFADMARVVVADSAARDAQVRADATRAVVERVEAVVDRWADELEGRLLRAALDPEAGEDRG